MFQFHRQLNLKKPRLIQVISSNLSTTTSTQQNIEIENEENKQ